MAKRVDGTKGKRAMEPAAGRSSRRGRGAAAATGVAAAETAAYTHTDATSPLRPEVGTQTQFFNQPKLKRPPAEYRYDSSLAPTMEWDGQNGARDLGAFLLRCIEEAAALPAPHAFQTPRVLRDGRGAVVATVRSLADAVEQLKRIERPFLNWAGKAERLCFDVPTLPLFVHERLSTKAILETLRAHRRDKQMSLADLFGDPQHPVADQVLKAYEHQDQWRNRLILGDSLVVMNSLLRYEGLGGQVQMIYIDPPYGVKFGSNFQPFVRARDVTHNDDEDMTREPEMVKAYRDTWELGLHSYLTYLRDRLLLARELLHPSGSVFVQISDENLHHVRELLDEVFGAESACGVISYQKTGGLQSNLLAQRADFLLWYARNKDQVRFRPLFLEKSIDTGTAETYRWLRLPNGTSRGMSRSEWERPSTIPEGARIYKADNLTSQGNARREFEFRGKRYVGGWKTTLEGMQRLASAGRLHVASNSIMYVRFLDDFACVPLAQTWTDTSQGSFLDDKLYVVQTARKAVERCLLMTTDPGDLVLDPTCGSGTTAYVAEQWGRRWITCDTSRVPLALARQRLLTATFPYYELKDEARGPGGGFVYRRKQNSKGEEIGGIVPHVTLKSIANDEPPDEEVLVDRPEIAGRSITRVTGPFVVEATIPTPMDMSAEQVPDASPAGTAGEASSHGTFVDRMIEVLRRSPILHLGGNRTVELRNVRAPARTLSLSAEAVVGNGTGQGAGGGNASPTPVAILFGPENGAVSERAVFEAAREAHAKSYSHLYVIGFAIEANARKLIGESDRVVGIPATSVQATPDLMMGDLLKNMRSSQIFSVCGLPEIAVRPADAAEVTRMGGDPTDKSGGAWQQVELLKLHVFDPATMEVDHRRGDDVPCWMLDTDYNGLCFKASQVFFPRTAAWDDLRRALRTEFAESVWDHLAGATSAPFQAGPQRRIAVKVIDDRGNELLVVHDLSEAGR